MAMANPERAPRRRPRHRSVIRRGQIHTLDDRQLHAILGKLHKDRVNLDLSERQEWLWDRICGELIDRNRRKHVLERCSCWYCCEDPLERLSAADGDAE